MEYYREYNKQLNIQKINTEAVAYIKAMVEIIQNESLQKIVNDNSYIIGVNYNPDNRVKNKVNELIMLGFIENADSIATDQVVANNLDIALKINPELKNIPFIYSVDISEL